MMKLKDRILGGEHVTKQLTDLEKRHIEASKCSLEFEIKKLEKDISQLKLEVEDAKSKLPIDFFDIGEKTDMLALKERALKKHKELYDELF